MKQSNVKVCRCGNSISAKSNTDMCSQCHARWRALMARHKKMAAARERSPWQKRGE